MHERRGTADARRRLQAATARRVLCDRCVRCAVKQLVAGPTGVRSRDSEPTAGACESLLPLMGEQRHSRSLNSAGRFPRARLRQSATRRPPTRSLPCQSIAVMPHTESCRTAPNALTNRLKVGGSAVPAGTASFPMEQVAAVNRSRASRGPRGVGSPLSCARKFIAWRPSCASGRRRHRSPAAGLSATSRVRARRHASPRRRLERVLGNPD